MPRVMVNQRASRDIRTLDEKTRSSPRSGGALRAALLLLGLLALVLGVFGAVYFDQFRSQPVPSVAERPAPAGEPQPAMPVMPPQLAVTTPEKAPLPATVPAVESPQPVPPPSAAVPTAPAPVAPPESAAPSEAAPSLAVISPAAAPANVAAAVPRYWIEFGAYDGEHYAGVLRQNLAALGIEATITTAPGKAGKRYLRVRTRGDSDHTTAAAEALKARNALHISPLLHRAMATAAPAAAMRNATGPGRHWVQFGAFHPRQDAENLAAKLLKNGLKAIVIERGYSHRKPLYRVRVGALADRAAAERIAEQGEAVLHSRDILIGQAPRAGPFAPPAR